MNLWTSLAVLALALQSPALAQTAVDGDTIRLDGATFRLWGIDVMGSHQVCADGWPGGAEAAKALAAFIAGKSIICAARTRDHYGRTIANCRADGEDLGAAMVLAGMALAHLPYNADYLREEEQAKAAKRGLHAHTGCVAPWQWRKAQHTP
jgi:endonuclease YncB( thermonuclease family)